MFTHAEIHIYMAIRLYVLLYKVFLGGSDGKESACNAGDLGLILGFGRSPGGGHGNPLRYSYLENSMDSGAWRAAVLGGRKESDTNEWLSLLL